MKRKIIKIDEDKCNGCELCIPSCPEGAIQMIDGKARLISDLFCDGLGACLGECPEGAITIEERDAAPYDEREVLENIIKQGPNVIKAHIDHLLEHNDQENYQTAINILKQTGVEVPMNTNLNVHSRSGCPGSKAIDFANTKKDSPETGQRASHLQQWPVQLHLVSPQAPYFQKADVLLSADCVAYTVGDFHKDFLKDKRLAIACPKLDSNLDIYVDKITQLIDNAHINTLTVMIMEVPCCGGLLTMAEKAAQNASRKIPIKQMTVSLQGDIISEEWL